MKVQSATINFFMRTVRAKADGTYNIILRINYNGKKEIYTGISCSIKFWDLKNQCIKRGYPNYELLNTQLNDIKQTVIRKKLYYESSGLPYTVHMLAESLKEDKIDRDGNKLLLSNLIADLIDYRQLRHNTIKNYRLMMDKVEAYCHRSSTIILTEVDERFMIRFCKWMKGCGVSDGTICTICSKIASIWNYAIGEGLVSSDLYCFKRWKYNQEYIPIINHRSIREDDIIAMQNYFITKCVVVDAVQGLFTYDSIAYSQLQLRYTKEFALLCYLLMYRLQGLSVADMSRIKVIQIEVISKGGKEYYIFNDIRRSKTNVPVQIVVEKDEISMAILEVLINTAHLRDGYLLPILCDNLHSYCYDTEKKIANGIMSAESMMNKRLREVIKDINKSYDLNINENISFYSGRHSFASHYIAAGGSPFNLSTLMGRSPSGIYRYVKELNSIDDIIRERERIFKVD